MRKGCFIKTIITLTIFVGVIAYIVQYKLDEWIMTPGKKILMPAIEKGFNEQFSFVEESAEKDSLIQFISNYFEKADWLTKNNDSAKINFWNNINLIAADSIVTGNELMHLKKIFEIENERSTEN